MRKLTVYGLLGILIAMISFGFSNEEQKDESPFSDKTFAGLNLRGIGQALMSVRIDEIAIQPGDPS